MTHHQRIGRLVHFVCAKLAVQRAVLALWETGRRLAQAKRQMYPTPRPTYADEIRTLADLESAAHRVETEAKLMRIDVDQFLLRERHET